MSFIVDNSRLKREANDAFGAWLSAAPFEWYTTHTFATDKINNYEGNTLNILHSKFNGLNNPLVSTDKCWWSWWNTVKLAARVRDADASPFYFRVAEYQNRGTLHFHSLIGGVGDLYRMHFKKLWELYGFARVEKYIGDRGANFYVGKYLTKNNGSFIMSKNLAKTLKGT